MIITATILRSNPHIVREIYIDDEKTMFDFLLALEICFACKKREFLNSDEVRLLDMTNHQEEIKDYHFMRCGDFLQSYPETTFLIPMAKSRYQHIGVKQDDYWQVRISRVPEEEYVMELEGESALLIRWHGLQPIWECSSISECNRLMQKLWVDGNAISYGIGRLEDYQYQVNSDQIHRYLKNLGKKQDLMVTLDEKVCCNLKVLFSDYKLDELKESIRRSPLKIDMNCRKNVLIDRMAKAYDCEEFWEQVIEDMEMTEYEAFRSWCFPEINHGHGIQDGFYVLRNYCLVQQGYYDRGPRFAEGLVKYYAARYLNQGDEDIRLQKMWMQVFKVAARLYLIFDKIVCKRLAEIMFPEELDPGNIARYWKRGADWSPLNAFIMYNSTVVYMHEVYDIIHKSNWADRQWYLPVREEAFLILEHDLRFSYKEKEALLQALQPLDKAYYWMQDDWERVLDYIYKCLQFGNSRKQIQEALKDIWGIKGTRDLMKHFMDTIEQCRGKVRRPEYKGFTQEEYDIFPGRKR